MDQTVKALFALLRSALCNVPLTATQKEACTADIREAVIALAARHDIDHLAVLGLQKNALLPPGEQEERVFMAVCRYEQLQYDCDTLCAALEEARIPYMPLKGTVIRRLYPEAWMRTSCDIDVLVHPEDADRASQVLTDTCGYRYRGRSSHDLSLYSPSCTHVELHFDLVEDGLAGEARDVLQRVWDHALLTEGSACRYALPEEFFYFYHIAHMAKHFEHGGCGIRPFVDLWMLDALPHGDERDSLLMQGGLVSFARAARLLSRVWMEGTAHDPLTRQMEAYIVQGGVYGTNQNRILLQQQKKGGRLRYALSKIFIPYDVIRHHYPILQRHPWLTPIMEVRRWCKLCFGGHLSRTRAELQYAAGEAAEREMKALLHDLGL